MPILYRKLAIRETDRAPIQEPWVYGDWIHGMCNRRWKLFSAEPSIAPRSCNSVSNTMYAFPTSKFCSKYMTTVKIILEKGAQVELIVASAYLWFRWTTTPSKGVNVYCSRNKKPLILGSDASAHHIISGNTDKKIHKQNA
jgi:hypothetical protein